MVRNTGRHTVAIKQHLDATNTALCSTFNPDLNTAIAQMTLLIDKACELRSELKDWREEHRNDPRRKS